jgi:hypothetical protein
MKITKEVQELWKQKNKRLEMFNMCKYCSDSGCDNPNYHEQQLMQLAYELGKAERKRSKR